ncbi:MAG: hypothetical protein U0M30_02680, partial [Agathobaculum butyriciproducens]
STSALIINSINSFLAAVSMIVPPFSINILILSIPEFSAGNNPFCQAAVNKLHKYTGGLTCYERKTVKLLLQKVKKSGKI